MKGVSSYYEPGEVDLKALIAGNDVLLFAENVPVAIDKIKQALKVGILEQAEIDARCRKILKAKRWAGLDNYEAIDTKKLVANLNAAEEKMANREVVKKSITLVKNSNDIVPLKELEHLKIATVSYRRDRIDGLPKDHKSLLQGNTFSSG